MLKIKLMLQLPNESTFCPYASGNLIFLKYCVELM